MERKDKPLWRGIDRNKKGTTVREIDKHYPPRIEPPQDPETDSNFPLPDPFTDIPPVD